MTYQEVQGGYRNNATVAGLLLMTALVAGILSVPFSGPVNDPDYLVKVAENENVMIIGVFLQAVMAFACAGIAIWLYPVLRKHNESLALGSVGFRIIEAVLLLVSAASLLSLLTLSQEYMQAGASDTSHFQDLGSMLLAARDWSSHALAVIAFSLGALMYYYIFYKTRLIPRWLSGWGLIAITLHLVSGLLVLSAIIGPFSGVQGLMSLPIGLQEMVLAIWLMAKGFNR